ncbi:MAG TPA: M56 family metallopeptidase [Terriglobales bacterium]|nr:M56 family metallopeptidase [Terriglobales bacterium]
MNFWLATLNQAAATGLAALLNTLWYAAAVVALAWLLLPRWQRLNAATRYWIWTGVLGFMLALPFLPSALAHRAAAAAPTPAAAQRLATAAAPPAAGVQPAKTFVTLEAAPRARFWPLWLLLAWAVAAAWKLRGIARALAEVRRLKRAAAPVREAALPLHLARKVRLLASGEAASPMAVGYRSPAVIISPQMLSRLEERERQDVLLHELAHLARYDDWLALLVAGCGALLALHPLAGAVIGRIEREREMACDDFVVARTGRARGYARSLARLHDLRCAAGTRLLAAGLVGRRSALRARLESLARRGRGFSPRPSFAGLGAGALLLALLLAAAGLIPNWIAIAAGQEAAPRAFYAASIKPGDANAHQRMLQLLPGGRFNAINVSLKTLVLYAYDIKPAQLERLPSWASSRLYSIQAVPPPNGPNLPRAEGSDAIREMLRTLLADRFGLRVHRVTKQMDVDELVVAKGGPKLKPAPPGERLIPPSGAPQPAAGEKAMRKPAGAEHDASVGGEEMLRGSGGKPALVRMMPGQFIGQDAPLESLVSILSRDLGRMVVDRTGLTGRYDFTLTWRPGPGERGMAAFAGRPTDQPVGGAPVPDAPGPGPAPEVNFTGPSLFTALREQLGLELKPAKGPVGVIVVDHVAPPTPN